MNNSFDKKSVRDHIFLMCDHVYYLEVFSSLLRRDYEAIGGCVLFYNAFYHRHTYFVTEYSEQSSAYVAESHPEKLLIALDS